MGYDFGSFSAGINYSKVNFTKGIIDDAQINLFFQKPVYLSLGPYSAAGKTSNPEQVLPKTGENTFTFELNNIQQLSPTGKNKDTIHTFSLQYSHFLKNNYYAFISAEVGYDGMPLYNQVTGGFGKKFSILPRVNFYSQIAFGSGGFAPEEIDTGSGFLVYPKLSPRETSPGVRLSITVSLPREMTHLADIDSACSSNLKSMSELVIQSTEISTIWRCDWINSSTITGISRFRVGSLIMTIESFRGTENFL
jgi:hypothetical protein